MPKKQQNFQKAFEELEALTEWFETQEVDLDEGMKKYERGLELAGELKAQLEAIENTVTKLKSA